MPPRRAHTIPQIARVVSQQWTAEKREQLRDDFQSQHPGRDFAEACRHYVCYMIAKTLAETEVEPLSPPLAVDDIWHVHLLDTAAYRWFCGMVLEACGSEKKHLDHSTRTIGDGLRAARLRNLQGVYEARGLGRGDWPEELQNLGPVPRSGGGRAGGSSSAAGAAPGLRERSPRRNNGGLVLYVRPLIGSSITLEDLAPTTTMFALAEKIQDRQGIPPDQQVLIFSAQRIFQGAKPCQDGMSRSDRDRADRKYAEMCGKTLADWNVQNESTMHLVSAMPVLDLRGC